MASIFLYDMGHISHCDIWEIFFPSEQTNKENKCGDDSQKQNMEASERGLRSRKVQSHANWKEMITSEWANGYL